jgi:tetratricopeptide (TPR) repeat protein
MKHFLGWIKHWKSIQSMSIHYSAKVIIDSKHKGDCLRGLNKYNEALPWLDKALTIDPNHGTSLGSKGLDHNMISLNPKGIEEI